MSDPTKDAVKAAAKEVAAEIRGEVEETLDLCPECCEKAVTVCKKKFKGQCTKCGQSRFACHDRHAVIEMTPVDKHFRSYYPGHAINGVWYKGQTTVPLKAANDLKAALRRWEDDERNSRLGREHEMNMGELRGR